MRTVACLNDLRDFGIYPLTGEADALSYRILCDVDAQGKQLIEDAYGGITLSSAAWNPGTKDRPHIASIMLDRHAYRQIGPMALVRCCHTVIDTDDGIIMGFEDGEEFVPAEYELDSDSEIRQIAPPRMSLNGRMSHRWPSCYGKPQRFYRRMAGSVGDRNQHAMSGRVA